MKSKELINTLSTDLRPVKTLVYGLKNYILILVIGFLSVLVSTTIAGVRPDIQDVVLTIPFLFQGLILLLLAILTTLSALQMSIPNLQTQETKNIAITALATWLAFLIYFLLHSSNPVGGWGVSCAREIALNSIIPSAAIFFMIKRAATLNRTTVSWLILTAGASYGALATQFSCNMIDPLHLLIWHALPVLIIGLIGLGLGNLILKKV